VKIAFVDLRDPTDPHIWSGTPSRMIDGFSAHSDVMVVGKVGAGVREIYMGHNVFYRLGRRKFDQYRTRLSLGIYSARLRRVLARRPVDAVVACSSIPVARLDYAGPIAYWTDSTICSMIGYYEAFTQLCARSRRDGDAQERAALARCDLAIYASDWAADECRRLYPEYGDKVRVVPFGANFDPGLNEDAARELVLARPEDRCHLLFVGTDWNRKGGDVAVAACQFMNAAGMPTSLTIVGCQPFLAGGTPPNVEVSEFLSPAIPRDRERLAALFRRSHLLILPTRAECYGIVLCEAAAFAVPGVATRTGGTPSIIDDYVTGRLLAPGAGGQETAEALLNLFKDRERYREVSMAAFRKYRAQLNWNAACASVLDLLQHKASLGTPS
jgi:glycosyltransferase involved in cell wall biosynthesis